MSICDTVVKAMLIMAVTAMLIVCAILGFMHIHINKIAEFKFNINGSKKSIYSWIKFK